MMRGFVDHRRCGGKQLRCHLVAARPKLLRATWCMGARGARTTWLESIGHPLPPSMTAPTLRRDHASRAHGILRPVSQLRVVSCLVEPDRPMVDEKLGTLSDGR